MTTQDIIDEIKLELTGYVLEMEIDDKTIESVVKKALRELERFWDETTVINAPYASCIDLSFKDKDGKEDPTKEQVSSVVRVYRTQGVGNADNTNTFMDPAYAQQWMLFSGGGTMYNLNDFILNYASWSTVNQIRNTMSTDMSFKEDRHNKKLYINNYAGAPGTVCIEYIPKLKKPDDIKSDYWIDILIRLSMALTKIVLGRIRTRFSQSNALWGMDGEKLLEEGNTEYKDLIEILRNNSNLLYPID